MADRVIPHFQNDPGVPIVHVGTHEIMCIGALPPFDHPHVFLDLGADGEVICPYCSTLYRMRGDLGARDSEPAGCLWTGPALAPTRDG